MKDQKNERISEEFSSFMKGYEAPPTELSQRTLQKATALLKTQKRVIWAKIFLIRALSGAVTLFFCPQFGWNPFSASTQVPHAFMSYGAWACGLFCGAVFMGSGALVEPLILSRPEQQVARGSLLARSALMCAFFIALLMALGTGQAANSIFISAGFALSWFIGAMALDALSHLAKTRSMPGSL